MSFSVLDNMTEDQEEQFAAIYKLYGENSNGKPSAIMKNMKEFRKERKAFGMPQSPAFLHMMAGWPFIQFRVPYSDASRDDCRGPVGENAQATIFQSFREAGLSFWYMEDTNSKDIYFYAVFDKHEFDRMAKYGVKEPGGYYYGFKDGTYPMAILDPRKRDVPRLLWEADHYEELIRCYEQDLPKPVYHARKGLFRER